MASVLSVGAPSPETADAYDDEPAVALGRTEQVRPTVAPTPGVTRRRGGFLSFSGGISNCGVGCSDVAMGGLARFEAGYRWPHVALGASFSMGGADLGTSRGLDGYADARVRTSLRYAYFGPFAQLHFVESGSVDPYVAVGLGYHRLTRAQDVLVDPETIDINPWDESAGVRLGAGAPLFLGERVSLGPRFDYVFPVDGRLCQTVDGQGEDGDGCTAWSEGLDGLDGDTRRALRRARPRPWSLALEIRVQF